MDTLADDVRALGTLEARLLDCRRRVGDMCAAGGMREDDWMRPDNTCPRCRQPAANLFRTVLPGDELETTHCGCLYASGVLVTKGDGNG